MAYDWLSADIAPLGIMYVVSFIALFIGSITDLKTREVPDWLNFGLIGSGIGLNLLFSAIYSDTSFIINSLVGLAIFFGIAYVMFYAGQWGGGDSKILMGLGAAIGIDVGDIRHQFLPGFFINALFAGAIYGLLWSVFLVFRNRKKFPAFGAYHLVQTILGFLFWHIEFRHNDINFQFLQVPQRDVENFACVRFSLGSIIEARKRVKYADPKTDKEATRSPGFH